LLLAMTLKLLLTQEDKPTTQSSPYLLHGRPVLGPSEAVENDSQRSDIHQPLSILPAYGALATGIKGL